MAIELPDKGRQVRVDGSLATVRDADWADEDTIELSSSMALVSLGGFCSRNISSSRLLCL
jgi:hypothetical protein